MINYICTGIFVVEAIIKLIAFDKKYFREGWNVFDFVVVIGSLIFLLPTFKKKKGIVTIIRAFRITRVVKLFKRLKNLQLIIKTVKYTLPSFLNIGILMLLLIYIFSIIGVELFADVKVNPPMTRLYNF